nr:MAG TPA: hypothetical protein [Caudoviricetes sp.]
MIEHPCCYCKPEREARNCERQQAIRQRTGEKFPCFFFCFF